MVIGYIAWKDFVEEAHLHQPGVIRVQAYIRNAPTDMAGLTLQQFWLEAAFTVNGEVHVARWGLGNVWEHVLKDDTARQEEMAERMKRATEIVRQALEAEGFTVRPGLVAAASEAKVETQGLLRWKEVEGRLLPEAIDEVQA